MVDYDPLPVVIDPHESLKDETLLFPEAGTNVAAHTQPAAHAEDLFDGCDVVVSDTLVSQRMAPCPLEPRSIAATFEDGKLTAWLCTQAPHADRDAIAGVLGLEPHQIRVIAPDVGGAFGAKIMSVGGLMEDLLVAWVARKLGGPVSLDGDAQRVDARPPPRPRDGAELHDRRHEGRQGARVQARRARRLRLLSDPRRVPGEPDPADVERRLRDPAGRGRGDDGRHEHDAHLGAARAGRPEAIQAIECAIDRFAMEIGMDPAEVRRRNYVTEFPTRRSPAPVRLGRLSGALDLALRSAGYDDLRAEQKRRREEGGTKQLGIGLSSYVEITNPLGEAELGEVEITPDGGAIVRTGSFSHGQGHETSFAMIVAERLGLPMEKVAVHKGDTDEVASGTGTYGSKSVQIGGTASRAAADTVVEQAKQLVARLPGGQSRGRRAGHGARPLPRRGHGGPLALLEELATRAGEDDRMGELKASSEWQGAPTFPFGTHVALVEVDTETGAVELQKMVCVDDAGTLVNPLLAEGQVHGGVAMGVAQALYEHYTFAEDGHAADRKPRRVRLPIGGRASVVGLDLHGDPPRRRTRSARRGSASPGRSARRPPVYNAVVDALSHYGVKRLPMPANGENVWRALQEAKA